jgi:hypothetical protein
MRAYYQRASLLPSSSTCTLVLSRLGTLCSASQATDGLDFTFVMLLLNSIDATAATVADMTRPSAILRDDEEEFLVIEGG